MINQDRSISLSLRAGATAAILAIAGWSSVAAMDDLENRAAPSYDINGTTVAAPDPSNYLDLRLGFTLMPKNGYEFTTTGANRSGDFDTANRISVMAIGPVCSIIPINCFTPARVAKGQRLPATIDWGQQEGWNWLGGFEISRNHWFEKQDANAGTSEITLNAYALTFHVLGLGVEYKCFGNCRLQIEGNPFIGVGWGFLNVHDPTVTPFFPASNAILDEDRDGLYYELGFRLGMFFTLPFGLQFGGETRYNWSDLVVSDDPILRGLRVNAKGFSFGGTIGYRF